MSDQLPIVRLPWRPRKYTDPQQFNDAVDAYFAFCTEKKEPITWTGLALFMGFSSRKELMNYENYDGGMAEAAARARSLVEYAYEMRLDRDKPTGAIFALKNMGWSDRQGIDLTSSDGSMSPVRIHDDVPDDDTAY